MRLRTPTFARQFACLGSLCRENCCIGWEIDIDPETAARYMALPGTLGDRLRAAIREEDGIYSFKLDEKERCPFLNSHNLCDIQCELGHEALCQICRDHPRFCGVFDDLCEKGPGLCCEAAARDMLQEEGPLLFEETDMPPLPSPPLNADEKARLSWLLPRRESLFILLQDHTRPLSTRLKEACTFCVQVQETLDGGPLPDDSERIPDAPSYIAALLTLLSTCESLGPSWDNALQQMKNVGLAKHLTPTINELMQKTPWLSVAYEKLMVYTLFRYGLRAVFDGDFLSVWQQTLLAGQTVFLLDLTAFLQNGNLTPETCIDHMGLWSRQMEYSDENLSVLQQAFWQDVAFSPTNQLSFLPGYSFS